MPMPSYHPDFIVSCQCRKNRLRSLLFAVKEAEMYARRWPTLASQQNTLDFHADALAEFMYRNCGFPKGEPAPVKRYVQPTASESMRLYNEVIMAIPLGRSSVQGGVR